MQARQEFDPQKILSYLRLHCEFPMGGRLDSDLKFNIANYPPPPSLPPLPLPVVSDLRHPAFIE